VELSGEGFVAAGLVAQTGEQAFDGDVFVQDFPVEVTAADASLFALFGGGVEQTRKPGEWNADYAAVAEVDPHAVGVKVYAGCLS
jgi:hypothetical protein